MGRLINAALLRVTWYLLLAGVCEVTAQAAPILSFSSPQTFFSAAQVASTETFDEFQTNTAIGVGTVTVDGITYTSSNPSAIWYVSDTFVTPSQPNSLVTSNAIAPATLTFGEGRFTPSIGFFLVGIGGIPVSSFRLDVAATDGQVLSEQIISGSVSANLFRGFTYQNGISSIAITPLDVAGDISNFHLDNVSRGVISTAFVPEPSSLTLAVIGVAGLGCWSWRCSRVRWQREFAARSRVLKNHK
jgi:hypothetical protein